MEIKSIAWLHHQKALRGKATWELHNDAACYFEQILAAATHKTATTVKLPPISQTIQGEQEAVRKAGMIS